MSEYLEIEGGKRLEGTVRVGGAKNAALPQLIATLLTPESCELSNVPNLQDVRLTLHLLEHFGAKVERSGAQVKIQVPALVATEASYSLVKALRASFWVLAPLLARGGAARVALPGGDAIGSRLVDMHLDALSKMGADIKLKHGVVYARASDGLKPAEINFRLPSVGATHQVLMAAALTPGETVLNGAAREPEIVALAEMLTHMGAEIEGAGEDRIVIRGQQVLKGTSEELIGDRIEAGTYILAVAATRGKARVEGFRPGDLGDFLEILEAMGVKLKHGADYVEVDCSAGIRAVDVITGPFPEFATDLQAPLLAALCVAEGTSSVTESIYDGRFGHVSELSRMGAKIKVEDRKAVIEGQPDLNAAPVEGMDIRGAAALVIGALAARGVTGIGELLHLRRGYEKLEEKLTGLGANVVKRVSDPEDYLFVGC